MQLRGKLNQQELKDVQALLRSKWYWPKLLLTNAYGFVLVAVILWASIAGAVSGAKVNWRNIGILWIVIAAIIVWAVYRTRRSMRQAFAEMNAGLFDSITLDTSGVEMRSVDGRSSSTPWTSVKGWRTKGTIALLDFSAGRRFFILPLSDLSATDREVLYGTLRSHFGEPTLR